MSGDEQPTEKPPQPKMTPQEYLARQSAESVQANQKIEVLDKIRTSNMIFRGQKQLQQLVDLKNRLLFGDKAVEATKPPDDTIQFDCKTEHHYHGQQKQTGWWSSALKLGLGVLLAGTGVGSAVAIPMIANGIMELMKPAVSRPAESSASDKPTVTIGGQEYQLELGEPDPQ